PVIDLVYGAGFEAAAPVLQALTLSLLFSLVRGAYTLWWYARHGERRVNVVNAAAVCAQLLLSLWLIPTHGALGAALALAATEALAMLLLRQGQQHQPATVALADASR